MRLLFSEARPDYAGYVFPYAVWGFLDPGETPATALAKGFLPSVGDLSRFYLCRQVRVALAGWTPDSENRRVLRKGADLSATLAARGEFEATDRVVDFCLEYATAKWSRPPRRERIERIFSQPVTTHLLAFHDREARLQGLVTLYIEGGTAIYSNAFYALGHPNPSLGLFLMTECLRRLAEQGLERIHLGTCYSRQALYKTQFQGVEFFDGNRWTGNLPALKAQIARQESAGTEGHLLEDPSYLESYVPGGIEELAAASTFSV